MMQLEDSSWADARREAFITLRDGVNFSHVPARLDVKSKGLVTHFYVTYGIKCSLCLKSGHKRANCPRKTGLQEDKLVLPVEATLHFEYHAGCSTYTCCPQTPTDLTYCCCGDSPTSIKDIQCSAGRPHPQVYPHNERSKNLAPKTSRKKRQGPLSRPPSSKTMPSNNSALSKPAAELSAPIRQTTSTPSSPSAPSPEAKFPVHPQETPTPEPPVPAPSTSQLLPRPEPSLAIIEPTAAPKKETQKKTAPPMSSISMQPLQTSQETKLIGQVKDIFAQMNAESFLSPLYEEIRRFEVVEAVLYPHVMEVLSKTLSKGNKTILCEVYPASTRESCIACGSADLSLAHRYWSCRRIRPVIVEALTIIQRPPDLQSWIFGHDLEENFWPSWQEDPLLVWRRTLSRWWYLPHS
ncbi:hypothetical protein LAZ67_9002305 [Cordylochernes scorpioides]|uniref:Uncharacterized protein n=1 Tax=Cordylochernes scorpioides TaxID=51811 RepID=A0ABY6KYP1_9ARAC|nr:hypothetical protein LAZ67_9002305 [Cordylochernes scorpioides]